MQDKNQESNTVFPDEGVVQPPPLVVFGNGQAISPGALSYQEPIVSEGSQREYPKQPNVFVRVLKRADVILAMLLIFGMVGMFIVTSTKGGKQGGTSNRVGIGGQYETQEIPLEGFSSGADGLTLGSNSVAINGSAQLNGGLIITPSLQPSAPKAGQLYYDQTANVMAYYDGTVFVPLGSSAATVQAVGGLTGQIGLGGGLAVVGDQLINAGVLSVGGQDGAIVLGNGLNMAGNTLQNTGVLNIVAGSGIAVSNGGNGSVTISNTGAGTGTIASSGGTIGQIPLFTASQNIEDSLISQSGLTVTVSGDLSVVTGGLSLSNALTVANGGTGATSLAANGVLVGNGTGSISAVTAGGANLCLVSTAGAPIFAACPSSSGVTTLNSLNGAVTIADSSTDAMTGTITIEDASTTNKGIAQFNGTNFTDDGAGTINTVQDIDQSSTPTFAGINTNSITPSSTLTVGSTSQALILQGDDGTILTATSGANTTTVGFNAPSASVTINFPALSAGNYDICTTSGNCLGGGGGGANTALSNLAGVAINTTLLPGSAGGIDLGSATLPVGGIYLAGTSVTPGTNNFLITGASTGGTRTITLPDASGTVCINTGNCAGAGTGVTVSSSGTAGTLPVFSAAQTIEDSLVSQSGGTVTVDGNLNLTTGNQFQINGTQISSVNLSNDANLAKLDATQTFTGNTNAFRNGTNSSSAFSVQNAVGTRVLTVDTTAGQIQLGTASTLDGGLVFYNGSNASAVTIVPGTPTGNRTITLPDDSGTICLDTGNCASAGATLQTAYDFSTGGTTPKIKIDDTLRGVEIQDADAPIDDYLLTVRASDNAGLGQVMFGVNSDGEVVLQSSANSTTALQLLTQGGTSVLTGDTQNGRVILGQGGTLAGQLLFQNATNSNVGTLQTAVLGQNTTYTLPDPGSASTSICLASGNCAGVGGTGDVLQGGNTFGAALTLGTNDNFGLNLETNGTTVASFSSTGAVTFQNASDSAAGFQVIDQGGTLAGLIVDNSSDVLWTDYELHVVGNILTESDLVVENALYVEGAAELYETLQVGGDFESTNQFYVIQSDDDRVLTVDTTNAEVELGMSGDTAAGLVFYNASNTNTASIWSGATSASYTLTLPTALPGSTQCLQSSNTGALSFTSCVASASLQSVYDADADGSDSIIALTSDDDGIIIRNPASSGSDSTYNLVLDQLSTGAKGGLSIQSAGSGNLLLVTDTTATSRDVLTIANGGAATFRTQTDSSTAFRVLSAAGTARFTVDTSGGNVTIGASDTTGALLVLDTKTGSGDPTGVNGGMYYNSNMGRFRCYEASSWKNCIYQRDYISVQNTATQNTPTTDSVIQFNFVSATSSTNISFTNASDSFTLQAGKTYLLRAVIPEVTFGGSTGYLIYQWYSLGSSSYVGSPGSSLPTTWASNTGFGGYAEFVVAAGSTGTFQLKVRDGDSISSINTSGSRPPIVFIESLD